MKRAAAVACVVVAAVAVLSGCASTSNASGSVQPARSSSMARLATSGGTRVRVTATVDGDTFRTDVDGQSRKIRILGIIH